MPSVTTAGLKTYWPTAASPTKFCTRWTPRKDLAFMRFVPAVATDTGAAQAFATFQTSMIYMTLVRMPDKTWHVWGIGGAMVSATQVFDPKS